MAIQGLSRQRYRLFGPVAPRVPWLGLVAMAVVAFPAIASARNADFYPPTAGAKAAIDLDNKGFLIHGRRALIMSGSIHYPRVPHELWRDRLLRLKRGGFNTVQTYVFWNYHEPREGVYRFTGDADIEEFLATAQRLGLYATVRPGPYVCAEWDLGGYPVWIKFKGAPLVRSDDPAFLALNDHWYQKIIPMIARHQINLGGNVVMVQLENEHPRGWGVIASEKDIDTKNPADRAPFFRYFKHLEASAVGLGLEVPHFMSGLHHGGNPAPPNIDPTKERFPWFTTESWAGWFNRYRTLPEKKLIAVDEAQWTILAHGGTGYNFYMLHGGSNFDSWNDQSGAASYDYGAAIGQAGDLRPMYYRMKRANQLGGSFPDILANASDALATFQDFARGSDISVLGARQSDAGTLIFLRNAGNVPRVATFQDGRTVTVPPHGTYPIPHNVILNKSATLMAATLPILAMAKNDDVTTVIVYGCAGETGHLTLKGKFRSTINSPAIAVTSPADERTQLEIKVPAQGVAECQLDQAERAVRILAVNDDLSLYTWILGEPGRQHVVFGPAYVEDLREAGGEITLRVERPYGEPSCGQVAVYGGRGQSWHLAAPADRSLDSQPAPQLGEWQMATAVEPRPETEDSKWMQTPDPRQMGADGDYGCFAWYRATVDLPAAGAGTLYFTGADDVRVFVNGAPADCVRVKDKRGKSVNDAWNAKASFTAGRNVIAVLVSHRGRDKEFGYIGSLADRHDKGLIKPVSLAVDGRHLEVKGWRMRGGLDGAPAAITTWKNLEPSRGLPAFYRTTFEAKPPGPTGPHPILRAVFAGLSRGTMWVNGHNLGQYPELIPVNGLYIPECWLKPDGRNELTIFDTEGNSPSPVHLEVEMPASREVMQLSRPVAPSTPMVVPPAKNNRSEDPAPAKKPN